MCVFVFVCVCLHTQKDKEFTVPKTGTVYLLILFQDHWQHVCFYFSAYLQKKRTSFMCVRVSIQKEKKKLNVCVWLYGQI